MVFNEGKSYSLVPLDWVSKLSIRYFTNQIDTNLDIEYLLISIGIHKIPIFDFDEKEKIK